jgi:DNA-binding NtrC family response regulator
MPSASARDATFCLRGYVGGIEQTFPLREGVNRVGSLEDNEVFLPRRGVSRQHARLTLEEGELRVDDLGSKNGTFLDGRRVESGVVRPDSELRFGPVELQLRMVHRDDNELAITFDSAAVSDQTGTIPVVESPLSGAGLGGTLSRHWLRLAEAFHARLFGRPGGDMGAALRLLQEELMLRGAGVLELPEGGDVVVLAAAGDLEDGAVAELPRSLAALFPEEPRQDLVFHTSVDAGTGGVGKGVERGLPATFAALTAPGTDPLVLVLLGAFPGRAKSELLLRLLARMLEPCRPHPERPAAESRTSRYPGLVLPEDYVHAQSAAMNKIYQLMQTLARGDLPILVTGETGVGKEYLAHILHDSSPRRHGPFIAINCAAIPAELLEAELFGIGEKVATGVAGSKGKLLLADGGTLFLDEIGDMSADLQAKLLRALQEKEVHPVGRDPVSVDVRVLAATNQELKQKIAHGDFRADLYYRLAGYVLEIPPLRERPEDVPALVEHFLRDCARELGKPIRGLTVRALKLLTGYPWPGNVRELANEVRRAVYLCPENGTIESSVLSPAVRETSTGGESVTGTAEIEVAEAAAEGEGPHLPDPMGLGLDSLKLEHLEALAVKEALRRCDENQVQAAKLLGISRQSLRRRMERLGLL